jgi:hypothetical protein
MLGYASATARCRADRHRGERIDRITGGKPVRKFLFVEMFRDTRLPMAEYRPDYRARVQPTTRANPNPNNSEAFTSPARYQADSIMD